MKTIETGIRIEIKNILFATDFSPAGDSALPYATEFAKRFGARLYALHVRPPSINPMTQPTTWPVLEENAKVEADAEKQTLLKSFPGIQPQVLVEEGDFWDILKSTIEKHKIDLIVLGTRGRSGAGKFFMGSTAEGFSECALCRLDRRPIYTCRIAARRRSLRDPLRHGFRSWVSRWCLVRDLTGAGVSSTSHPAACNHRAKDGRPCPSVRNRGVVGASLAQTRYARGRTVVRTAIYG